MTVEPSTPPVPHLDAALAPGAVPTDDRYRWMVENVREVIFEADPMGNWTYLNPAWAALLGHPVEACIGRPFLDFVHPDDRQMNLDAFVETVQGGKDRCRVEARYLTAGGGVRHMEIHAWIFRDADGTPQGSTGTLTDVTDRNLARAELERRATHDVLTGLPNRSLLADRVAAALARAAAEPSPIALLFLDLDRFKLVNDSLGHDAGDEVLCAVADRIRRTTPPASTVARFGGDEFVVLVEGLDSRACRSLAARIRTAVGAPLRVADRSLAVTASVGIRLLHADEAVPGEVTEKAKHLLRDADAAMYEAKDGGRDRTEVFGLATRERIVARLDTETMLRAALDHGELELHYQPQLVLDGRALAGLEALLRWNHPVKGLLAPAEFIGVAEESGLVVPIGRWVLEEACRFLADPDGPGAHVPRIAVNISARQLQHGLVATVAEVLADTGVAPSRLRLELTESALLHDAEVARTAMTGLTDLGVDLSLDDFGTGFSSLSYLQRLPLRELKIDRSFVARLAQPDGRAIVSAIIAMADALGLETCAEGVENDVAADVLDELGCDVAQGYRFARPVPARALPEVLATVAR